MPLVTRYPPGSPPGPPGGVQVVTVPVSSAQILDLANTPVVLISGVAGSMIAVDRGVFAYLAGVTPYTDHGGSLKVGIGNGGNPVLYGPPGAGFWDQVDSVAALGDPSASFGAEFLVTDVDGTDVVLVADSNPTLGVGTLLVTVSYFLAPTV